MLSMAGAPRHALTHRDQSSAAESCHGSHDVEEKHGVGRRTAKASDRKRDCRDEEAYPPPKHVGEASVQRLKCRACDQVRRGQPGRIVGGVEVGADGGICRGCDCAVES